MIKLFQRLSRAQGLRKLNCECLHEIGRRCFASKTSEGPAKKDGQEKDPMEEYRDNHPGLMEFFDTPENWGQASVRVGRPWKIDELRLKSNSDLHKLWFILYKEKNMLLTMQEQCLENGYAMPNPERIEKVEESMENLENVVRERNRAYFHLEVGENSTAEQPKVFRLNPFGQYQWMPVYEHYLPYKISKSWKTLFGPRVDKDTQEFFHKIRERRRNLHWARLYRQHTEVRQLLRRFPDTDVDYLQKRYPNVPVQHYKEMLDYYPEHHHHISQGVFVNRMRHRRART